MKLLPPTSYLLPSRPSLRWLLLPAAAIFVGGLLVAQTDSDPDGDGIPDVFDIFFGLAGAAADPAADPDGDGLDNAAEKIVWTDPLNADTDYDGFSDGIDDDPVSRALYFWGDPRFTYGETNAYPRPLWAGYGFTACGAPVDYPGFGRAVTLAPGDGLFMTVKGSTLTNSLRIATAAFSSGNLLVDLLDLC